MDTQTSHYNRRRPWVAAFLSLLMPGLGQLYCGAIIRCLALLALTSPAAILSLVALIPGVHLGGCLVVSAYAFGLLVAAFAIVDAFFTARRTRLDYEPKDYNRWYAYALMYLAVSAGHIFSAFYVRDNLIAPFKVPTSSMYPAIWQGDQLFAEKGAYMDRDPAVGDIVVLRNPEDRRQFYIKRVVALGGDEVAVRDGELFINGTKLRREETPSPAAKSSRIGKGGAYFYEFNREVKYRVFLAAGPNRRLENFPATVIPKHQCFVLGDNRENSLDSRSIGAIPIAGIVGKAAFIYAPAESWSRFGGIR